MIETSKVNFAWAITSKVCILIKDLFFKNLLQPEIGRTLLCQNVYQKENCKLQIKNKWRKNTFHNNSLIYMKIPCKPHQNRTKFIAWFSS